MPRKRTHAEYVEEVKKRYGDEFSVLGEYKNKREQILVRHNPCSTTFEVYPNNFLKGYRCKGGCKQKRNFTPANKKTHEQFVMEVYNLVQDEYIVIGEYRTNKMNITMRHEICMNEYPVTPSDFKRGNRCPFCSTTAKKTTETFKQEVYDLVKDEYEVIGEYEGANKNLLIHHVPCGHKWDVRPSNFLFGSRCPTCNQDKKKKTHEQFVLDVRKRYGDEYQICGTYAGSKKEVLIRHAVCGKTYPAIPNYLLSGNECPHCFGTPKKTTEAFKEELYALRGEEYLVLGEYKNSSTGILIRHNVCGHEWSPKPSNLLSRESRCPKCYGKIQLTNEDFIERVFEQVGNEYTPLSEYQTIMIKVLMRHNDCGFEYPVTPNDFLNSRKRCPKCNGGVRRTHEEYIHEVFELVCDEYTILGEYVNAHTKIDTRHNKCSHIWGVRPADFIINGSRCPACNESKGEWAINSFLIQHHYVFEPQFKLEECSYQKPLPFDFAVFENEKAKENKDPFYLIEFHGQQHYEPVDFFGGEVAFEFQKIRDRIKEEFCKNNDIPLMVIPFWNLTQIEEILMRELDITE